MRRLASIVVVALLGGHASGQGQPKPDTPGQAAGKVLAAFEADDGQALKALAEKDEPDPWLVADELCSRGRHDAAGAFARAAPRYFVMKLPAYVESRRNRPDNAPARRALSVAEQRDAAGALAALDGVEVSPGEAASPRIHYARGMALRRMRRLEESAKEFGEAAGQAEKLGWYQFASGALRWGGFAAYERSDWPTAVTLWERQLAIAKAAGQRFVEATTLGMLGLAHTSLGDVDKAIEHGKRALALFEEVGARDQAARALSNLGMLYTGRGKYETALDYLNRGLEVLTALDNKVAMGGGLSGIGRVYMRLGEFRKALEYHRRALAIHEQIGNPRGISVAVSSLALVYHNLAEFDRSLEYHRRALELCRARGDRDGAALTIMNMGLVYEQRGQYAKALEHFERALRIHEGLQRPYGVASALMNLANLHSRLGNQARAIECYERALAIQHRLKDPVGAAQGLGNLATAYNRRGDHAKALSCFEKALAVCEERGDRAGVARTLGNIGATFAYLGRLDEALDHHARALALSEELGARDLVASSLAMAASVHNALGELRKALDHYERALVLSVELGRLDQEVMALWRLAGVYLALEDPAAAVRHARLAVEKLPAMVEKLADEQGAGARGQWEELLETGYAASVKLDNAEAASFFVESGRAGALLESLGNRDALAAAAIPADLRETVRAAREAVSLARARYDRARPSGERAQIRAARKELDAARADLLDGVARIQRAAKASADVVYPKAAALDQIAAQLAQGETMVSYVLLKELAGALVVGRDGARLVELGTSPEVEAAVAELSLDDPASDPAAALAALHRALVEPLKLTAETGRVFIAPHKTLAYVPFALLMQAREVAYVPSGSTYRVLRDERDKRGTDVLALGDPIYPPGGELERLPGTRVEATAVGDVVLLAERATETSLARAVARKKRWRAVHLACHGRVKPERPQLSSLALTAEKGSDGALTVLEIFRMKIPADLVVVSACETAKGKVYRAEGVIGFARAFMMAGAPRVIVSLWKVDDEATRALMVKFYDLWRKHPTATALKKAQQHVASHDKWKHPYYWAAWQLWGLGD